MGKWASQMSDAFDNAAMSRLGRRIQPPPIAWLMEAALGRPDLVSLAAGFTDNATLPVGETRAAFRELFNDDEAARKALQYGSTAGDAELLDLTASRLAEADGASASDSHSADRMLITHGSQQFLSLVTECLFDEGDIVIVEDPTYFVFLGIAQSRGIVCRGVRTDPDGINVSHLGELLEELRRAGQLARLKAVYLVSYCQNPSGRTTSFEKKQLVLSTLRQYESDAGHPLYLIEDAAYRELAFPSTPPQKTALSADGATDRLIYTGTYSKPFATGLRVGFGILPEALYGPVKHIKSNQDFGTAHLLQQLLLRAIKSGLYDKHVRSLVRHYQSKAAVMRGALRDSFPGDAAWEEPAGGLYFWAKLPESVSTGQGSSFFEAALKHDVLYVPGGLCYADDEVRPKPDCEMRLSFGNASNTEIEKGIGRLGQVIRESLE